MRARHSTADVLDRLSPGEMSQPPSARTWARIIHLYQHDTVLEMRDPHDGIGHDPAAKTRYQYVVAAPSRAGGRRLFGRRLPPAPLTHIEDVGVTPRLDVWADDARGSAWSVRALSGLIGEWARTHGAVEGLIAPARGRVTTDIDGMGTRVHLAYRMPPADPRDLWAAITGVPCPQCGQTLAWDEAGRVPGARACMRERQPGAYDLSTRRHEWALSADDAVDMTLVLYRTVR